MANPFDRFDQPQGNPFDQFDERQQQPIAQAPAGFDVNAPVKDVEAALANMPEPQRKEAIKQWGQAAAKREQAQGMRPSWLATNVLRGTPIGSWLDEIEAGPNALLYKATGGKLGTPYELSKAQAQARFQQMDSEDTKLGRLPELNVGTKDYNVTIGGDVTTGSLARLGGGAATAGMTVRPFQGATVLPATGNAIATGAVYGGVAGAGEGEGWDRAKNAAIGSSVGATIGGAAVPLSYGVGGLIQMGREALSPTPQALQPFSRSSREAMIRSATDDNLPANFNGGERARRLGEVGNIPNANLARERVIRDTPDLGQQGMLLDMGPNMRGQASAIYNMPGEGKRTIGEGLQRRYDTAPSRLEGAANDVFGGGGLNERSTRRMITAANQRARPYYDQADNAVWRPQASQQMTGLLERANAAGVTREAERLMRIEGIDPAQAQNTFRYFDYMKRAADDLAQNAGPRTNGQRLFGNLARDIRNEADRMLVAQGEIARDAAGNAILRNGRPISPYQYAREIGADERGVGEAIEAGQRAFRKTQDGNRYTADRMAEDIQQLNPREQTAYRRAARQDARDASRQAGSALRDGQDTETLRMFSSPDARDKVRLIARNTAATPAAERTDRFLNTLDAEAKFAKSRNEVTGNSATAGRLQAQKEFPQATTPEDFRGIGNRSMFGTAVEYVLARPLNAILGGAISEARARKAADVARMLTAQGANRDAIAGALIAVIGRRNITQQQAGQIRELIATALQAPRNQIIASNP